MRFKKGFIWEKDTTKIAFVYHPSTHHDTDDTPN